MKFHKQILRRISYTRTILNHNTKMSATTKITWDSIKLKPIPVLSPGFVHNNVTFTSGFVGAADTDGKFPDSIEEQVHASIKNLELTLAQSNLDLSNVFKVNAYLSHSAYKFKMNEIYAQYFKQKPPRTCVVVQFMNPSVKFEIEAFATSTPTEKVSWESVNKPEHPVLGAAFVNKTDNIVHTSGIVATPSPGNIIPETAEEQTVLAIENLKDILEQSGSSLDDVFKVTGFIAHADFAKPFNEVYGRYFKSKPARSCVIAEFMDVPIKVELEAIASINGKAKKITWDSIQGQEHPVLSPGFVYNDRVYSSGIIGSNYGTGVTPPDIEEQIHLAIKNLKNVLVEGGSSLESVFKVNLFISHSDYIGTVNKLYSEYFPQKPARTCIVVAFMDAKIKFEIEAVASL